MREAAAFAGRLALGSPAAELTAGELAETLETLALHVHPAAARRVLLVIRRDGYLGTEATLAAMEADADLRAGPGTAAHLIRGSSEGRLEITDSPGPRPRSRTPVQGVVTPVSETFADRLRVLVFADRAGAGAAAGERSAVAAALCGEVTPDCPASILRTHPQATLYPELDSQPWSDA